MKSYCQRFIAAGIVCFLPLSLRAEAPVVDESDNFTDDEQHPAAAEQPLAHDKPNHQSGYRDEPSPDFPDEQPLAHEATRPVSGNNASLLNELQSLQKDVQELRGQLEVQAHELTVLKEQQLSFYKDIDNRLHANAASTPAAAPIPLPPTTTKPTPIKQTPAGVTADTPPQVIPMSTSTPHQNNPAEEQIHYLAAYDLIRNKRFDEAVTAMQSFVNQYPKGGYTANAHYWLGELYMTKKNYPEAINHFDTVLQQFPASSKAAPSLLKMAYALNASGKKQEAIVHLKQIIKNYPDTHTAHLAEQKLKSLTR